MELNSFISTKKNLIAMATKITAFQVVLWLTPVMSFNIY